MTERAHIAATHRDNRKQLAPDRPSTGSRKRDCKKWCRGKVGVKHEYQNHVKHWTFSTTSGRNYTFSMKFVKCVNCGREEWRGR